VLLALAADVGGWVPLRMLESSAESQGSAAPVTIPSRAQADVDLVAVAVPLDEFLSRSSLPGGASAQDGIEVFGEAVPRERQEWGGGWERAPVHIRVRLDGYQAVERVWRVADNQLPWIELEPAR